MWQDPVGAGSARLAQPAVQASCCGTPAASPKRGKASRKARGKAAVSMKRPISYLYTFINRHGAEVLSPDALPVYRRVAACAGCTGISGAHRPTVFPEPLHTLAEPGCGLTLPRDDVFFPTHSRILFVLCPVSLVKYLNSEY